MNIREGAAHANPAHPLSQKTGSRGAEDATELLLSLGSNRVLQLTLTCDFLHVTNS